MSRTEPSTHAPIDGADPPTSGHADALTRLLEELARTPPSAVEEEIAWQKPLSAGDVVGRFELLREAGRGGFGVVYEARDRELGRLVAFKALRPGRALSPAQAAALRKEAEAAAQLNHPNIVTVHDFGTCPSGPYLIMELLRGEPLAQRLAGAPLAPSEALRVAVEVARALVHAHAAGVAHRDLKPGNVYLRADGAVKVLDFGLARLLGAAGARGGTPGYMAPEQGRGEEDERADLYGLGALLFRMLSGEAPPEDGPARLRAIRERAGGKRPFPPAVAALLERLLADDPGARPAAAAEALAALEHLLDALDPARGRRRRRRRSAVAAAVALAAALGAAIGLWMRIEQARALEHPTVAVADFANETDDPALEGLSSMLITSLEQSRKIAVLTRSRMRDELRRLGHDDVPRIDAALAREVGRATGTRALLVASLRRVDDTYSVEVHAYDPASDRDLFEVSAKARGRGSIPGLIDRVSERTRRELRERAEDVTGNRITMGEAMTKDLEAYRHYFLGMECMERPGERKLPTCAQHFLAAVAVDPDFALAHFQLALIAGVRREVAAAQAHIAAAARGHDRVPPKERGLILGWKAHLDGRDDEALAHYAEVIERYPTDKQATFLAGDLLWTRGDYAAAVPYLDRTIELDPSHEPAVKGLVWALGALRREDALRERLDRWARLAPTPALRSGEVRARFWLSDHEGALAAAQRAAANASTPSAAVEVSVVQFQRGQFSAAEATLEAAARAFPDVTQLVLYRAWAIAAQGRIREALALFDAAQGLATLPGWDWHVARARLLAAKGDVGAVWAEAREAARSSPEGSAVLGTDLAILGDVQHARDLMLALPTGSSDRELLDATLAWRSGDPLSAMARLRALDAVTPILPRADSLPPSYVLAEVAAATGRDAEVLEAVRRLGTLWNHLGAHGSWIVPRAQILAVRAYARLGRRPEARSRLDPLLREWAHADEDVPFVADARTLLATLQDGTYPP